MSELMIFQLCNCVWIITTSLFIRKTGVRRVVTCPRHLNVLIGIFLGKL